MLFHLLDVWSCIMFSCFLLTCSHLPDKATMFHRLLCLLHASPPTPPPAPSSCNTKPFFRSRVSESNCFRIFQRRPQHHGPNCTKCLNPKIMKRYQEYRFCSWQIFGHYCCGWGVRTNWYWCVPIVLPTTVLNCTLCAAYLLGSLTINIFFH